MASRITGGIINNVLIRPELTDLIMGEPQTNRPPASASAAPASQSSTNNSTTAAPPTSELTIAGYDKNGPIYQTAQTTQSAETITIDASISDSAPQAMVVTEVTFTPTEPTQTESISQSQQPTDNHSAVSFTEVEVEVAPLVEEHIVTGYDKNGPIYETISLLENTSIVATNIEIDQPVEISDSANELPLEEHILNEPDQQILPPVSMEAAPEFDSTEQIQNTQDEATHEIIGYDKNGPIYA